MEFPRSYPIATPSHKQLQLLPSDCLAFNQLFFLSKGRRAQSPNVHFQLCSFNLDESVQEVKGLRHGGSHSSPGQIGQGLPKDSDMESSYGQ